MSIKKYYIKDGYFNNILTKYFNDIGWIKENDSNNNPFLYHANFSKCNNCKITNDFIDTSSLGNKTKLSSAISNIIGKKKYLLDYYIIDKSNYYKIKKIFNNNDYWIIKPGHGLRQQDIIITNTYKIFENHIINIGNKYNNWIIQKYITNPLLINNKKCHLRVYCFVKRHNNLFESYLYKKGYIYVADKEYINKNFKNAEIHLTSSCNNLEFPKMFDKYFGFKKFENKIYPQLKEIIRDTIKVSYKDFNCPNNKIDDYTCYKFIGYDIILDNKFNAYLMEANSRVIGMASSDAPGNCKSINPSLQTPKFKKDLMYDMMNIILNIKSNNNSNFDLIFKKNIKILENFNNKNYINITLIIFILIFLFINHSIIIYLCLKIFFYFFPRINKM